MSLSARHYARLGAVQFLYSWNIQNSSIDQSDEQCLMDYRVLLHGDLDYFRTLVTSIPKVITKIDALLKTAVDRKIDLVDQVEMAILRLGVYELKYQTDVPFKVVVNECIELSREFGNLDSYRFINATLDKLSAAEISASEGETENSGSLVAESEYDIIKKHFINHHEASDESVVLGIGDDAAVVDVPADKQLVVSTDTSTQHVHFPENAAARQIGYRVLAVALSDIAAMGASPAYAMLNLSIPEYDSPWLEQFSLGFFDLANHYRMRLIGGDTVKGALSIGVTVFGLIDSDVMLTRSGAKAGDGIYVTGTLGDAGVGLQNEKQNSAKGSVADRHFKNRFYRPQPRIDVGIGLQNLATAAIDISDGLIADLSHVLKDSQAGAIVDVDSIPISAHYKDRLPKIGWDFALSHGDDYELCFTAALDRQKDIDELSKDTGVSIRRIGTVTEQSGLQLNGSDGKPFVLSRTGYSHF